MNDYKTQDFYLAAYLKASGIELQNHVRHAGLTTFVFDNSQQLQQLVRKFYDSVALINPIIYGHALRELKGMIHATPKPNNNYVTQYKISR